jgi:hypothetical protein
VHFAANERGIGLGLGLGLDLDLRFDSSSSSYARREARPRDSRPEPEPEPEPEHATKEEVSMIVSVWASASACRLHAACRAAVRARGIPIHCIVSTAFPETEKAND